MDLNKYKIRASALEYYTGDPERAKRVVHNNLWHEVVARLDKIKMQATVHPEYTEYSVEGLFFTMEEFDEFLDELKRPLTSIEEGL